MILVLDTHAWLWWGAKPEKLSPAARQALDESSRIGISPISCFEVGWLVARKRIELDRDVLTWVKQGLALPRAELLPLTPEIAVAAAALRREVPGDPAGRIIVATALAAGARLVTNDGPIRRSGAVPTVW